jgi:hypothetical protein
MKYYERTECQIGKGGSSRNFVCMSWGGGGVTVLKYFRATRKECVLMTVDIKTNKVYAVVFYLNLYSFFSDIP